MFSKTSFSLSTLESKRLWVGFREGTSGIAYSVLVQVQGTCHAKWKGTAHCTDSNVKDDLASWRIIESAEELCYQSRIGRLDLSM